MAAAIAAWKGSLGSGSPYPPSERASRRSGSDLSRSIRMYDAGTSSVPLLEHAELQNEIRARASQGPYRITLGIPGAALPRESIRPGSRTPTVMNQSLDLFGCLS